MEASLTDVTVSVTAHGLARMRLHLHLEVLMLMLLLLLLMLMLLMPETVAVGGQCVTMDQVPMLVAVAAPVAAVAAGPALSESV